MRQIDNMSPNEIETLHLKGMIREQQIVPPNDSEHEHCRSEIEENWKNIEAQLDFWQDMDNQYWQWRKEQEYERYIERQRDRVRKFFNQIDSDLKEAKNENTNH